MEKEFAITITGDNDVTVGLCLICLALIYHLVAQKQSEYQAAQTLNSIQYSESEITDCSLPPNPFLLGRKQEIETLNSYFASASPVCLIEGFGGVGKTSLAISSAYNQKESHRFKNIVWISTKGLDLTLFRLIDELISGLDKPYIMKMENHKRPLEVLKILRSETTLIILDLKFHRN